MRNKVIVLKNRLSESAIKGFTLAEILVVISVLAVVGVIFTEIFFRSIRGNNRAQILNKIKQEGQNVMNILDREARNAENIICPNIALGNTKTSGNVFVVFNDSMYTRYTLKVGTDKTNGAIHKDSPKITDAVNPESFLNSVCQEEDVIGAPNLTDANLKTGVSILGDHIFTREQKPGQKDFITISFQIAPPLEAPQAVAQDIDPVQFQTTVGVR